MSYILEALKKAEEERRRREAGNVMKAVVSAQPSSRQSRPLAGILAAAAVIGMVGVGAWIYYSNSKEPDSAPVVMQKREPVMAPATAPPVAPLPSKAPAVADGSPETRTDPGPKAVQSSRDAAKVETKSGTEKKTGRTMPAKAAETPAESKTKAGRQGTAVSESTTPDKPAEIPARIHALNELPEDIRALLPPLIISTHIYSTEPSERLVSISGHVLREGQELAKDIRVETILPDGAILNCRGYRVKALLR